MSRLLLLDDHTSFREMLAFVFEREPQFEVVAQAGSLAEAREKLEAVDIAVIDLDLPDGDGSEILGELHAASPNAMALILTANARREAYARAVEAGAAGALHKAASVGDIVDAVQRLLAGDAILSAEETIELLRLASRRREQENQEQRAIERITPREREVLQALTNGLSDKEIAERLHVGVGTVRNHLASIFGKLGVQSRLQALLISARRGVVELD